MTHETDAQLATRLAVEAGHVLLKVREELAGAASWRVMDMGDIASHQFLVDQLKLHRPDDAVMSEEGVDDPRRFTKDRVWIVDPLDGTNEFGERGRHDWAVHVALWHDGAFAAGAVSLPAIDMVFSTDPAPVVPPPQWERPRLVTSRNRNPPAAVIVANAMGCDAVRLGSAGAKAMAVMLGEADIYVTHTPCVHCFKTIVNTGIRRVFYEKPYKLETIAELRERAGVELVQVTVPARG